MINTFLSPITHRIAFFFLLGFCLCSSTVLADSGPARGSFGFFGGLNIATIGGDFQKVGDLLAGELESEIGGNWRSSTSSLTGLGLGIYYLHHLSPSFGLQIEGQYIRRGGTLDLEGKNVQDVGSLNVETGFKLGYLEIPVLARYRGNPEAKVRPVILGGPVVGIKVSSSMEVSAEGQSQSQDISEGVNSTTFGLLVGAGIAFDVGKTSAMVIQGRYYLGLTEPMDDPDYSTKSGDFGFFVGLEFALGAQGAEEVTSESGSLPR